MATQASTERVRVSMPVLYPSGSGCTVEIGFSADKVFVSDMAAGHTEAYLAGATDYYDHQAKRAAERFGIGYDGHSIFVLWAPIDRVEGAITAVANASVQAASLAVLKAEEDRERRRNDEVYERVRQIFGAPSVAKIVQLEGRRAVWPAHNVVTLSQGKRAVFEFVSMHANSIANKYMMFSDVAARDEGIALNAVVRSLATLGVKGGMLSDVANVIELTASNDDFLRYARVA
ncbi:hypothetical protein P9272_03920 [Mesorhizobium sp. WSM4976]|uniref:hypothetical protein n=1 Tax=Mesorhizobium sp. WSM4976 TaxID=3038549 RepID=UPI002416C265|nr:hypothetical protein [Mesorhizobium sp. WSM4976]MDG4892729.1 hypothetical protein [Mesorhizobium sp. WSM4976]